MDQYFLLVLYDLFHFLTSQNLAEIHVQMDDPIKSMKVDFHRLQNPLEILVKTQLLMRNSKAL